MSEELQQSVAENAENTTEVEQSTGGETVAPEVVETDEEKNARVAAEATEKARIKEERRQQSVDKRFAELTREKYEAREQAKQMAEMNARMLALIEGQNKPQQPNPGGEPRRDQFESYEDYVEARAEFRAQQTVNQKLEEWSKTQEQRNAQLEQQRTQQTIAKEFVARREAAEKEIPDFREVVEEWEPKLPDSVVDMITRLPEGPLISYHLAKNPELEKQFTEQPAYMHGVLIGQLLSTLKSTPKASAAPAPGKPVSTRSVPSATGDYTGDEAGYWAWAQKNLK